MDDVKLCTMVPLTKEDIVSILNALRHTGAGLAVEPRNWSLMTHRLKQAKVEIEAREAAFFAEEAEREDVLDMGQGRQVHRHSADRRGV